MAQQKPVPARLHVLLASDARSAVVIRRGPSRRVAVIGWDRTSDRFKIGQWLHGRIYERRCDLSPDGRHLIYFAMNGRWGAEAKGSWSAVSRAPYLKALTLWAKGDCWHGGGLFKSTREYWLNDGGPLVHELIRDGARLKRSPKYPWHEYYGGECLGVYYIRLQRDGWVKGATAPDGAGGHVTTFDKPAVNDAWTLRKLAFATMNHPVGTGCYFDRHQLVNRSTGRVIDLPGWEWADLDDHRLVWAEEGCQRRASLGSNGLKRITTLHDFNPITFEPLQAPY